jgi:hypothetical protein
LTVRKVEAWDGTGLGPLADVSPDDLACHYRCLAAISVKGRPYDTTALLLAHRGHASPRLQVILRRELHPEVIPRVDPWSPQGIDVADGIAEEVAADLPVPSDLPTARLIRSVLRNVGRASRDGESEMAQRSLLAELSTGLLGGRPIDSAAASDAFEVETRPDEKELMRSDVDRSFNDHGQLGSQLGFPGDRVHELIENHLIELVSQVPLIESILRSTVLPKLDIELSDQELAELSVLVAAPAIASMELSLSWLVRTPPDPAAGLPEGLLAEVTHLAFEASEGKT